MHPIFFAAKRTFHSTLRVARNLLAPFGLTPARFDMMVAALDREEMVLQTDLRRILGVSAATVSRMLKALEKLQLVERSHLNWDLRQRRVQLTLRGWRLIWRIIDAVAEPGYAEIAVDSAVAGDDFADEARASRAVDAAIGTLRRIAVGLHDRATLVYRHDLVPSGPPRYCALIDG